MFFQHSFVDASVVFWGAIVCFVLIGSFFKYKTRVSQHRMMEKLAEKGQTLSPELLASLGNGDSHKSPVTGAIFMMLMGVAIAVFLWCMTDSAGFWNEHLPNWLPVIGIFPFIIGLSRLVGMIFEKKPRN